MKHLIALNSTQLRIIQLALAGYVTDGINAANQNPQLTDAFTRDHTSAEEMISMFAPLILIHDDPSKIQAQLCPSIIDFPEVFKSTLILAQMQNHSWTTAGVAESVCQLNEAYHELLQYYCYREWYKEHMPSAKSDPVLFDTLLTNFIEKYKDLILAKPGMEKLYIPAALQQEIDNVGKQVEA